MAVIRIQVAYVTAGTGHRRAAQALAQAARERFPYAQVACVDALEGSRGRFAAVYESAYLFLVRYAPWLWRIGYHVSDTRFARRLTHPLRLAWNLWVARAYTAELKINAPDIVICTHFLPASILDYGRRKGWLSSRVVVVVTDWHPHQFWIAQAVDATVVSSAQAAQRLQDFGVEPDRIHALGIPVDSAFGRAADQRSLLKRLDLQEGRKTVLITSGGTIVGCFEPVVRALAALEATHAGRLQLLVVCGNDAVTRVRLSSVIAASGMPIRVFGFVDNMPELMAASDLVVAKAGGLTLSETFACGLPLILYHAIPGQEETNASVAVRAGAAVWAPSPAKVADAVRRLLTHPAEMDKLCQGARAMSHPQAAEHIAQQVLAPLAARSRACAAEPDGKRCR